MKLDAQRLAGALKRPSSLLILAGLLGLGLIFLSDSAGRTSGAAQEPTASTQIEAYEAQMERRLTELIERMDGAGQAQVMVTFEATGETVYALDERISQDGSTQSEHVLAGGQPVTREMLLPTVQGVAVLCQGGDDVVVQARVTEAVSVLLGITTNRISVAKMN